MKRSKGDTDTKKRIARSAKQLFAQKGYLGTSIDDIVAASESSKGNVYYHFKNKEGLFLYLIEEQVDDWIAQWSGMAQQYATLPETLYALAEHAADDLKSPLTKAAEEFRGSEMADPVVVERIIRAVGRQRELFQAILREASRKGEIGGYDYGQLAHILYSLFCGLGMMRYDIEEDELTALHRTAVSVFLHGTMKKEQH